ncbi:MAG TPA: hypothetical protein VEQ66_17215 [Propionibacteriaceae bacterium]|nr:hypothetical protein [Propionibacteriaceae bacterium]
MLIALAAAVVVTRALVNMALEVQGPHPMTPYVAPQYWLTYEHGFVRRALLGQVVHILAGSRDPSYHLVNVVAVALSVTAVLAVVVLALMLARRVASQWTAVAVFAAVLVSPLGLPLFATDIGRSDSFGVVILVLLLCLPWRRLATAVVVAGVAVVTAAAVAAGEYLVAPVLPAGLAVLCSALAGRRGRVPWTVAAITPCLLLTVMSGVVAPPLALVHQTTAAARAAGVPPAWTLVPGQRDHDSVSRLKYGFFDNLQTYYSILTPQGVVATTILWVGVYLLVVCVVWRLLGWSLVERRFLVVITVFALSALALSGAGIDYRRWWSLAVVGALGTLLQVTSGEGKRMALHNVAVAVAMICLAVAGLLLQYMPLWPMRSLEDLRARIVE